MNILVVCHYGLYEDLSYSFVHNQIREYAALGHRVRVIIPNGFGKVGRGGSRLEKPLLISQADGVELYDYRYLTLSHFGQRGFNTASAIAAIGLQWNRFFSDFRPDVIHAHTLGFDSEIGAWLKQRFNCPLVITTHGSDTNVPLDKGRADDLKVWCDRADAVVAVSKQLANRLRTCGTTTPVTTIYNGFVPRAIPKDCVRDAFSIIQVGNLVPSKRVDVTIRAFAKLQKKWPDLKLTVIGQGPLRGELEGLSKDLGVADSVCFLGQLPNAEVFRKMSESRFFVMASKPEGFGIVYLEAMAASCITIGTEGQGISDLIEHGVNGFLVPADDPDRIAELLDWCLRNPDEGDRIAQEGKNIASGLTWEKNAEEYVKLFMQLKEESANEVRERY